MVLDGFGCLRWILIKVGMLPGNDDRSHVCFMSVRGLRTVRWQLFHQLYVVVIARVQQLQFAPLSSEKSVSITSFSAVCISNYSVCLMFMIWSSQQISGTVVDEWVLLATSEKPVSVGCAGNIQAFSSFAFDCVVLQPLFFHFVNTAYWGAKIAV